jgi:hypothetical protein
MKKILARLKDIDIVQYKDHIDKGLWGFFWFLAVSSGMNSDVWRVMMVLPIPTGLNLAAQGCEARATLGKIREDIQPCKG